MIDYSQTPAELRSHVLEHDGCPLHYWTGGDANRPLVVMMHGATMDHRMFNAQIAALLPAYRVLVWDARGHGKSQPGGADISLERFADDMLRILDSLGIQSFVAAGQSLGGYIAQHLYARAPQRIQAVMVIGSTPLAKAYSPLEVWALKASLPLFDLWPYSSFTRTIASSTAITTPVQQYALEAARSIPRREFLRIWKAVTLAIDTKGNPDFRIHVPLLLIHGDRDRTGTIRRDMPLWAKTEPQAEYHCIPNAGHNANQDNPQAVNEILLSFLHRHLAT